MPPKFTTEKIDLAAEAAAMEARLLDLRKAMEKERAKRDAVMGNAKDGSIWKNGNSGLLRSNFRAKQQQGSSPGSTSAAPSAGNGWASAGGSRSSSRGPAAVTSGSRGPSPGAAAVGAPRAAAAAGVTAEQGHAQARQPGASPSRGSSSRSSAAPRPHPGHSPLQQQQHGSSSSSSSHSAALPQASGRSGPNVQGVTAAASASASSRTAGAASASGRGGGSAVGGGGGGGKLQSGRTPSGARFEVLRVSDNEDPGGGGIGCGTESAGNLMEGAFNEADGHRSFLEALNEWRRGAKGEAHDGGAVASSSDASGAGAGAEMQCQTDGSPGTRAAVTRRQVSLSAKMSLFDRMALESASKVAGMAALQGVAPAGLLSPPGSSRGRGPGGSAATPREAAGALHRAISSSSSAVHESESEGTQPVATAAAARHVGGRPHSGSRSSLADDASFTSKMDVLAKLEALEAKQDADDEDDDGDDGDDEGGGGSVSVVDVVGTMGLTKNVRLPDTIIVPGLQD